MKNQDILSREVLVVVNNFLFNEKHTGQIAKPGDLSFLSDGAWLKDAAVTGAVNNRQGAWDVNLVFAHYKDPMKLIVRRITTCFSESKALATAFYMRKEAAKDSRGTLNVSISQLRLCNN